MESTKFSVFLKQVAAAAGIDQDTIPNSFFTQIRDFADRRVSQAWDRCEWPGTIGYSQPTVNTSGNLNKFTYPTDADVIMNVYSDDPRTSTTIKTYGFRLAETDAGAREVIVPDADTSVTVEYKKKAPTFTGDTHLASGKTYSANEQAYHQGDFYEANSGSTSGAFSAGAWTIVKLPKIFQGYMVKGCYADYLRANGQTQEAQVEDQNAEAILFREIEKVLRVEGQNRLIQMNTY